MYNSNAIPENILGSTLVKRVSTVGKLNENNSKN
jgi:hypothetical protein